MQCRSGPADLVGKDGSPGQLVVSLGTRFGQQHFAPIVEEDQLPIGNDHRRMARLLDLAGHPARVFGFPTHDTGLHVDTLERAARRALSLGLNVPKIKTVNSNSIPGSLGRKMLRGIQTEQINC